MITIKYNRYIFFDKKTVGSARRLVRRYGVRYNSYAGEVLQRIYHFYFGNATDIKKEYKKYYKKEFEDFDKYLEYHMGVKDDVRRKLKKNNVYYVNIDEKGEHIDDSFSYEEELKDQFWNLVGGLADENSSGVCYEQFFN